MPRLDEVGILLRETVNREIPVIVDWNKQALSVTVFLACTLIVFPFHRTY